MKTEDSGSKIGTIVRIATLFGVIALLILVVAINIPKKENLSMVWDYRTTIGKRDAKNHFVMTTDVMCPYCDYFSRAIMSAQDEFEKYLEENDVIYEMRVTDFLYEYGSVRSNYSTRSAEAILCATEEDRFWDYYHAVMTALNEDYHSKGIGNSKNSPMMTDITDDYWLNIGKEIGLGDSFEDCYKNNKMLSKVQENTKKAVKVMEKAGAAGLPFFQFNDYQPGGFDPSWGWEYVKMYFDTGLSSKK